jgi:hypothetical protein
MRFQLAKTLKGMGMYGPIYDFGTADPKNIESFYAPDVDDWFLDNMVIKINSYCDTCLDDGDIDYIDAKRCKNLIEMIDDLPSGFVPDEFTEAIEVLKSFANRAIEYDTGIEIEM